MVVSYTRGTLYTLNVTLKTEGVFTMEKVEAILQTLFSRRKGFRMVHDSRFREQDDSECSDQDDS